MMNRHKQTVSVVFILCRFTVFLKDPIFILFRDHNSFRCAVKPIPVHRYSVCYLSIFWSLGLFGSDIQKQNTAEASGRGCFPVSLMDRLNQTESAVF